MRNGWRTALFVLACLSPFGAAEGAKYGPSGGPDQPVRLTVEVSWSVPAGADARPLPPPEVELELSEGRILGALPWPTGPEPESRGERLCRLGADRSGRVRARVEVPTAGSLILRAGGQTMRFPVASILEGPQRTPGQSPVEIVVERLPWDPITVGFGDAARGRDDGLVAPGSQVPVNLGFQIVTPEPTQVVVRCTAVLRPAAGGEPAWRTEVREVVPTNAPDAPAYVLNVPVPQGERTYVLEFVAHWEPLAAPEPGSLLGRLIRLGKRGAPTGSGSATRRVTLSAFGSAEGPPVEGPDRAGPPAEADLIDLSRLRGNRPTASGRSPQGPTGGASWPLPEGAMVESTRRDLLRGWMTRVGAEVSTLGPADPTTGLAWSAVGLKVGRPGRPHRLTLTVTGGHPSALGVAVVGPGENGSGPRVLLDACASGPPALPGGPPGTYSWLVWPDSTDPVLVLVNRSGTSAVQLGSVTLAEAPEPPPAPPVEPPSEANARRLGLALTGPDALDRFALRLPDAPRLTDPLGASRNLARYLSHVGASAVLLSEDLSDRDRRQALDGQAAEDPLGPDRLEVALRVLNREKVSPWLELAFPGALPGLPAPWTAEALARGLVRVDRRGQADLPVPAYQPLNGEVREALKRRVAEAAAARKGPAGVAGLLIRLGRGPTLPGAADTGFDDGTFAQFVREAFEAGTAGGLPGVDNADPGRFEARARFLSGPARNPWLAWRSKRVAGLYGELAAAAESASAGVTLAVVTPGLDDGPAGLEARRADLAGFDPSLAWRAVGLDLDAWPNGRGAPAVLRGAGLGPDPLAYDLANHPELDARVAARADRGTLLDSPGGSAAPRGPSLTALPLDGGPGGDEPLGHALAALDARWVILAATAAAGHEERLRQFSRVFQALPATADPAAAPPRPFGVAARLHKDGGRTYLALANDTPYPVRVETVLAAPAGPVTFDDLGRGARLKPTSDAAGHHLVLDLAPFGVAGVKVSSADVKVAAVTPYPSEAVLTTLQARFDEISAQLTRLTRNPDAGHDGPPNPGFEPEVAPATRVVPLSVGGTPPPPGAPADPAVGWTAVGGTGVAVSIDPAQRKAGLGSLRLDAPEGPASAASDPFTPAIHSAMTVRAWLRADRPEARVRLWVEGEAAGVPFRRVSELSARPEWSERAVRVGDIPAGGLDSVRIRFELLDAGALWVDDLSVTGASLSEPERRNARNALVAAIQAYREKRYADFARLAGSHWARLPGAGDGQGAAGGPPPARVGLGQPGEASALPQGRRLR